MASNHSCVNGTLDDSSYSSPVPFIGLYVAAATSVCFFLMLFDILSGFHNRKRWLPCRLFSLNSITLTLLSIATKIPVDLTTTMPNTYDQLSKLTGTTLICTCMGFIVPPLGINRGSDCWTNMVALSMLVVTVVANICIQMHTGVILLFKVEHVIIMCYMILLVLALWCFAYDIDVQKKVSLDQNKDLFTQGKGTMSQRLKLCYLRAYGANPQLELWRDEDSRLVGFLCLYSSFIVLQATFRTTIIQEPKLCEKMSDYQWSIYFIIATQIATILVGSFGTSFRWLTLATHIKRGGARMAWKSENTEDMTIKNPLIYYTFRDRLTIILKSVISTVVLCIRTTLVHLPYKIIRHFCYYGWCCCCCCCCRCSCAFFKFKEDGDGEDIKEFEELTTCEGESRLNRWILRKGVKAMKKWMQVNKLNNTHQFISKTRPSQESLTKQLKSSSNANDPTYEVSSLSVVLLVKIVAVSMPTIGNEWNKILNEVFEVIHFVDKKINSTSNKKIEKSKLAKATWAGKSFDSLLPNIANGELQYESSLDKAIWIIEGLKRALPSDLVWDELSIITNFISKQSYGSIEELNDFVKQLFVDILNEFFIQLPNAIYKDIIESDPEDYEEILGFALKAICQVEPLEDIIQWPYPSGTNITNLISDTVSTENDDERRKGVENIDVSAIPTPSIEHSTRDEIIQVE